jgi:hypothetical protein
VTRVSGAQKKTGPTPPSAPEISAPPRSRSAPRRGSLRDTRRDPPDSAPACDFRPVCGLRGAPAPPGCPEGHAGGSSGSPGSPSADQGRRACLRICFQLPGDRSRPGVNPPEDLIPGPSHPHESEVSRGKRADKSETRRYRRWSKTEFQSRASRIENGTS